MKVFDSHMHFGKWGKHTINGKEITPFAKYEYDTFEKIYDYLKSHNIAKVVAVPIYHFNTELTFRINNKLVNIPDYLKNVIIPGLWVDPSPGVRPFLNESLYMCKENNITVLKTSPSVWEKDYSPDPKTWDTSFKKGMDLIFEYLIDSNSIFQIHTGSKKSGITFIEQLIRRAPPSTKFHLVHMGNNTNSCFYFVPRLSEWINEGLNIVCDTSCVSGFVLRWIIDLCKTDPTIIDHILFASDEPWSIFESEYHKVLGATNNRLSLLTKIFWENASRVYS